MIGIVLWSSPARRQAIVWCEDHGPLAHLSGAAADALAGTWPQEGEMVEVTTTITGMIRSVTDLSIIGGDAGPGDGVLAGHLRRAARPAAPRAGGALDVAPLSPRRPLCPTG